MFKDLDVLKKVRECEKVIIKVKFEEVIVIEDEKKYFVVDFLDYYIIGNLICVSF